jgi:SOS response associated peptidase (SRAP)
MGANSGALSPNGTAAIPNLQPRFNACPTDPADTIVAHEAERELVEMRWGLVPFWWNEPLKELRLATFNTRVETVTTKPFFREPFKKRRSAADQPPITDRHQHRHGIIGLNRLECFGAVADVFQESNDGQG